MAEIIRKRKGQSGVTGSGGGAKSNDVNHNKTTPMREKAKEKIRKQMEVKKTLQSKKKKEMTPRGKTAKPSKAAPLQKGKNHKSRSERNVIEKDPNSKEVMIKKYVKDTKAGGRSKRGEFLFA